MKQCNLVLLFLLFTLVAWAAEIKNVNSVQEGDNIRISYEIIDTNPLQQFEVFVFYSIDGEQKAQALKEVTGDVGKAVVGGGNKFVLWNPIKELGGLYGKVKFKIVANPTVLLKTTVGKLDGMTVIASNCKKVGEFISVDLVIDNQKETNTFDLYTNYIKAIDNNGTVFYAINYIKGADKVTTRRPISIKKGEQQKITVNFERKGDSTSFFKSLELETKFPSNFMIIKNIPVIK
tara:strand:+ start:624 stop:1325 length:702 start_codon:yes stop_codon:yes gene_type:complete